MDAMEKAVKDFLSHCEKEKKLSEKTLKAYDIDLRQFLRYLDDEYEEVEKPTDVDKQLLRNYLQSLYNGAKSKTVKRKIATLRVFFNFLEFEDRIVVSPFRKMNLKIKQEKTMPRVMTADEVKIFFDHVYGLKRKGDKLTRAKYRAVVRDIAVLEMLFSTGMRVSELCELRQDHLDLENRSVEVEGTGRKERKIPLYGDAVIAAQEAYQDVYETELAESDFWFLNRSGRQLSDQSVRLMIEKYRKEAGLKPGITPHTFRHTVATMLLESGVDIRFIQYFLGHSSITTTELYVKGDEESQRELLSKRHPRFNIDSWE